MANNEQLAILRSGVEDWNAWRSAHLGIEPDLSRADLGKAELSRADLRGANLSRASLARANLTEADLSNATLRQTSLFGAGLFGANLSNVNLSGGVLIEAVLTFATLSGADLSGVDLRFAILHKANLSGANLSGADLRKVDLSDAILREANLSDANLHEVDLSGTDLSKADLRRTNLVGVDLIKANLDGANLSWADMNGVRLISTNLNNATLDGCNVYGISAWNVSLVGAKQNNLCITASGEPRITVDNLEVAQFLYMLLQNQKLRAILDTIASKVVLILGRFSAERKPALDALREALRNHSNGYIPVLFDFAPQQEKPVLDTVKTLANLARFVIADLTDPNMVRSELTYITANVPTVPVRTLIEGDATPPTEYETWLQYRNFLPVYRYSDLEQLLASLDKAVIAPVEQLVCPRRLDGPTP